MATHHTITRGKAYDTRGVNLSPSQADTATGAYLFGGLQPLSTVRLSAIQLRFHFSPNVHRVIIALLDCCRNRRKRELYFEFQPTDVKTFVTEKTKDEAKGGVPVQLLTFWEANGGIDCMKTSHNRIQVKKISRRALFKILIFIKI